MAEVSGQRISFLVNSSIQGCFLLVLAGGSRGWLACLEGIPLHGQCKSGNRLRGAKGFWRRSTPGFVTLMEGRGGLSLAEMVLGF